MKLDGWTGRQTDGQTDKQIDHYRTTAEWGPDKFSFPLIQGSRGISCFPMMFYYPGTVKGVYVRLTVIRKPFSDTEKLLDKV